MNLDTWPHFILTLLFENLEWEKKGVCLATFEKEDWCLFSDFQSTQIRVLVLLLPLSALPSLDVVPGQMILEQKGEREDS